MGTTTEVNQDALRYVSDLELQSPPGAFPQDRGTEPTEIQLQEGIEQSFLADKSLVSFVTNVSAQQREDVLQSTLLAQLAANKMKPMDQDVMGWYTAFAKVLANLGWIVESHETTQFKTNEQGADVDNVIIDVLSSAFGASYISIIRKTLEAIKSLSDDDNRIIAFEKNTQALEKGCFQLGVAVVENEAVTLRLGTFVITSDKRIKKILLVRIRKGETSIDYVSKKATFNLAAYNKIRHAVSAKIENYMTDYVAELTI
jgi:hypothetical protein